MRKRTGFSMLELVVTISILAMIVMAAVPMMGDTDSVRVQATADRLASDLELAQLMNISNPAEPCLLRLDEARGSWWIASVSQPETPLLDPTNGDPYLVSLGSDSMVFAEGVRFQVDGTSGRDIRWDASGSMLDPSDRPSIIFQRGDASVELSIGPTTGSIWIQAR